MIVNATIFSNFLNTKLKSEGRSFVGADFRFDEKTTKKEAILVQNRVLAKNWVLLSFLKIPVP